MRAVHPCPIVLSSRHMGKLAGLAIALSSAVLAAMLFGTLAHEELGISLDTIRTQALGAAGFVFLAVACGLLLTQKR
jgi:hypothetical protein